MEHALPLAGNNRLRLSDVPLSHREIWRVWLGVFPENMRARRAYAAVGFTAEGVARGGAFFGGVHRDELVMAILRPEWEAITQASGAI